MPPIIGGPPGQICSMLPPRCAQPAPPLLAVMGAHASAQALPAEVDAALNGTGAARRNHPAGGRCRRTRPPRLSHRANVPVNPASVMKLVTTYAALDLLGPGLHLVHTGLRRGRGARRRAHGTCTSAVRATPSWCWSASGCCCGAMQGLGVQTSRATSCWITARSTAPRWTGQLRWRALRPYNVAPDALLLNYQSVVMTFVPTDCQGRHGAVTRHWPGVGARNRAAGRRRGAATGARNSRPSWPTRHASASPAASRPPAASGMAGRLCRSAQLRRTRHRRPVAVHGRRLARSRCAMAAYPPASAPAFELVSPSLAEVIRDINKFSNNVMAQQVFLTLGLQGAWRGRHGPRVPSVARPRPRGAATLVAGAVPVPSRR